VVPRFCVTKCQRLNQTKIIAFRYEEQEGKREELFLTEMAEVYLQNRQYITQDTDC